MGLKLRLGHPLMQRRCRLRVPHHEEICWRDNDGNRRAYWKGCLKLSLVTCPDALPARPDRKNYSIRSAKTWSHTLFGGAFIVVAPDPRPIQSARHIGQGVAVE